MTEAINWNSQLLPYGRPGETCCRCDHEAAGVLLVTPITVVGGGRTQFCTMHASTVLSMMPSMAGGWWGAVN